MYLSCTLDISVDLLVVNLLKIDLHKKYRRERERAPTHNKILSTEEHTKMRSRQERVSQHHTRSTNTFIYNSIHFTSC